MNAPWNYVPNPILTIVYLVLATYCFLQSFIVLLLFAYHIYVVLQIALLLLHSTIIAPVIDSTWELFQNKQS